MLFKNIHVYHTGGAPNLHDVYRKLLHCWAKLSYQADYTLTKNYYFIMIFKT